MKLINGGVYQGYHSIFVLVYFNGKWGMLFIGRHVEKGMSAPCFQFDKNGKCQFTEEELIKYYDADKWVLLDGRLRIEKIDDMSLVEYTNGILKPLEKP